jgi:hypothetical protein
MITAKDQRDLVVPQVIPRLQMLAEFITLIFLSGRSWICGESNIVKEVPFLESKLIL